MQQSVDLPRAARTAAALYLGALGLVMMTAWHDPGTSGGAVPALPGLHLAFLLASGAAAALLTLTRRESETLRRGSGPDLSELMEQMSHELRTPLNAVIGFSEVMAREMYGPLGNARYQEYAHHISESGGRLLKSSEDTLAVAEAMSALMADRAPARRERIVAGPLVREAWAAAAAGARAGQPGLSLTTCTTCEIVCDRRATLQALEHLFREGIAQAGAGGTVEVQGRRHGGARSLRLRVAGACDPARASLRVILARVLLETQGVRLTCEAGPEGSWTALVEFNRPDAGQAGPRARYTQAGGGR